MSLRLEGGPPLPAEWEADARTARDGLVSSVAALAGSPPGFLEILDEGDAVAERCAATAEKLAGFGRVVLLGIGGSALGARTLRDALAGDAGDRLLVLDNIDPHTIARARDRLDPKDTAFLVISKSGSTAETAAQFLAFRDWLSAAGVDPTACMTLITDPTRGPLRELASRDGYPTAEVPPRVGGRFSVLSSVGLLPAALLGIDPVELLAGGRSMWHAVRDREDHPLIDWVVGHSLRAERDGQRIQVLMSYVDRLRTFGDWFAQLWGESLGKKLDRDGRVVHRGSTPLPALGATDQHSLVQLFAEGPADKQFLVLGLDHGTDPVAPLPQDASATHADFAYLGGHSFDALLEAERVGTVQALAAAGRPVSRLQLERLDARTLGALFVLFELATVLTADRLEVDPYDQPGVEVGKWIAFSRMGRPGFDEKVRELIGESGEEPRGRALI